MNFLRIGLASLASFVAYMVLGGLMFAAIPSLKSEFLKYPAVYRNSEGQMSHMPAGMVGMLLSIVALSILYAMIGKAGSGVANGAIFGALVGIYSVGSFVIHNYVNLNIGLRITILSSISFFIEWTVVGIVIGLIYKPAH